MSPEKFLNIQQSRGGVPSSQYYDAAKDEVFCFGVSLFEVCTGELPYKSLEGMFKSMFADLSPDHVNCMNFLSGKYDCLKTKNIIDLSPGVEIEKLENVKVTFQKGVPFGVTFGNYWGKHNISIIKRAVLPEPDRVAFTVDEDESEEISDLSYSFQANLCKNSFRKWFWLPCYNSNNNFILKI